jgi:hypothetical protein
MSSRNVTLSIDVDVDIELRHFDTSDIIKELESRNKSEIVVATSTPSLNTEEAHPLHEIYYAFKFGLTDRATDLARAYVCDELGVVL